MSLISSAYTAINARYFILFDFILMGFKVSSSEITKYSNFKIVLFKNTLATQSRIV